MAKLVYDETGRLLFTKEMKEEYTLLMPPDAPGPLQHDAEAAAERRV